MRLKQIALLLSVSSIFASCSTKLVSFKTNDDSREIKYKMKVPQGYKLLIVTGSHEKEYNIVYQDSTTIFISDDIKSGSFVNREKYIKYGSGVSMKFLTNDTLVLNGTDEKGRHWEERKMKNVVYGYIKVPSEKKEMFDKLLNSITSK